MDIVMRMLTGVATITATVIGHEVIKFAIKRNPRFCKQANGKVKKRILWREIDETHPPLHSPYWKKIGEVDFLLIYPVKSSEIPVLYDSVEFRDYGMCRWEFETYFWDGMFLVYNKTKGKFEDVRRYSLLRKIAAQLTNTDEVSLSDQVSDQVRRIRLDLNQYPNCFMKETWNGNEAIFYSSNEDINTWLKESIRANEINEESDQHVILTQMIPCNWDSTQGIKDNWLRYVEGYISLEEDETGKFITLPRFVLMTLQTSEALRGVNENITPNIIINTGNLTQEPFEEQNWEFIRLGKDVILKKVKPVPSFEREFPHYGIYYGLWSGGKVKIEDDICIYCHPDIQHK